MSSKVKSLVLFTVLFSVLDVSFSQFPVEDDGCRTPDRGVGNCIAIKQCPVVLKLLQTKPLTQEIIQQVKRYQCGFEGSNVKVCCPVATTGGGSGATSSSAPDVGKHSNLRLLPLDSCGGITTDDRIINGNKTAVGEFPWMALISYRLKSGKLEFQCGATLINERYVLTAAHCLTNLNSKTIAGVRLGEHNTRTNPDCETNDDGEETCAPKPQDMTVAEVIVHPGYERAKLQHDIGLLRLGSAAVIGEYVSPICLPVDQLNRNLQFRPGQNLTVAGWGVTELRTKSDDLLKVHVPYMTNANCKQTYQSNGVTIINQQLCAGGRNQHDSCSGDSGGPLKILGQLNDDSRFIQHGIVSFGPRQCGSEGFPGVYTRVVHYMDWILNNMKP